MTLFHSAGAHSEFSFGQVFELPPAHRPNLLLSLVHTPPAAAAAAAQQPYAVSSIAWAPSCGRSYHLIATGSRDGLVRVWKLVPGTQINQQSTDEGKWTSQLMAEFDDHR